jgi:L-asparagine oxygenase
VLFEPHFLLWPDPEHLRDSGRGARDEERRRPVLYGPRDAPYLRVDPAYTDAVPGDARAAEAFAALCAQLEGGLTDVPLNRGDVLLVDNHRAVHGRREFSARYDGTDRWLRKVTVVRDLRRSRTQRTGVEQRVLSPFPIGANR